MGSDHLVWAPQCSSVVPVPLSLGGRLPGGGTVGPLRLLPTLYVQYIPTLPAFLRTYDLLTHLPIIGISAKSLTHMG